MLQIPPSRPLTSCGKKMYALVETLQCVPNVTYALPNVACGAVPLEG